MLIIRSRKGVPIRLTDERWQHTIRGHSEMGSQRDKVLVTVAEPGVILTAYFTRRESAARFNNFGEAEDSREASGIIWDYGEEADVLYLSAGEPRAATVVDIGEAVVVRYDEEQREVDGLTVLGLPARLLKGLAEARS